MRQELNSYFEMMVHVPICTHAEPKNIFVISDNEQKIVDELNKYNGLNVLVCKVDEAISKLTDAKDIDVIICDASVLGTDAIFNGIAKKILGTKGVMSIGASSLISNSNSAKRELEALGESFRIVMPYWFVSSNNEAMFAYIASEYYHPTADINLQRADLTSGFNYYNSDIAIGAFSMPTMIRKEYLGLIKS